MPGLQIETTIMVLVVAVQDGYVNKAFLDSEAKTIAGNQQFDSPDGGKENGHKGHGAARISWEAKKCFKP